MRRAPTTFDAVNGIEQLRAAFRDSGRATTQPGVFVAEDHDGERYRVKAHQPTGWVLIQKEEV